MIDTAAGLRLLAWLQDPVHFAEAYTAASIVVLLALIETITLAVLVLRRLRCALAALALSAALMTAEPGLARREAAPFIRPPAGQYRVIRPARARALTPRPLAAVGGPSPASVLAHTAAPEGQVATRPGITGAAAQRLTPEVHRAADAVVAEAIRACRAAGGGAR